MIRYSTSLYLFILFESTGKTSKDLEWSSHWGSKQINAGVVINILWCYTLHMAHGGTVNVKHRLALHSIHLLLAVKQTPGSPATIKNQCIVVMEAPDTQGRFFFSVIVDRFYLFLNTFAQWKQTQWCYQKSFSPVHAKTFRIENFKAHSKILYQKLIFGLNHLNFISVVKSIKKAIAIKQRKLSLNRDEGLNLPAIYNPLFRIYNSFSVMQPFTSQCWWSSINLDKILVFCLKFCSWALEFYILNTVVMHNKANVCYLVKVPFSPLKFLLWLRQSKHTDIYAWVDVWVTKCIDVEV